MLGEIGFPWGGLDLQINGALGLAFPDLTAMTGEKLPEICRFLWHHGIDAFLPTLVTTSLEKIHQALAVIAPLVNQPPMAGMAQILGVHLEGPCLNPERRGAHPPEYLLPLTLETVQAVLGTNAAIVKIITLAPELDPTGTVIPQLRSQGMIVSLGHSQATAAQANQAFQLGASMVTHCFNAMPPLHHREPGLLGAAILDPEISCGLIADGQHVTPMMIDLLLRANASDQGLFLVSDALAPLGLPDGIYPWDSRQIEVKQGTARLPDGTLAGTTLPLLVGVQNLVGWGICGVERAIALATQAPRRAMGQAGLAVGQPAHFLRWHLDAITNALSWKRLEMVAPVP
ncbi:N-acetylglucosamine-6-phosphate deacetylase [Neosynechococcus sphagnicola]|uniref:N-acetylglucosamine-6-phosphate deacetylase n=1 Tax=Neosynechococcus sphagnicola TaxID=1501145 RepID=UPI001EF9E809|nr:N-acetylglucosamine-6-phosphate deacetylase [Neosynechococcus sphagnicola]